MAASSRTVRPILPGWRAQIGMVFQQFNLWPHMTALENVIEALRQVKRMKRTEAIELGRHFLGKVNLSDQGRRLSGAPVRRPAAARGDRACVAMQPKVMLFDEATSALDPD